MLLNVLYPLSRDAILARAVKVICTADFGCDSNPHSKFILIT
jgi:hypothetical protein